MASEHVAAGLPRAATAEGQAGLDAIVAAPAGALIASDYDGTLSPIVADPAAAHVHPGAIAALRRLAARVGTVAVITGRPVAQAVELGGLDTVPGLIVLGHYGWERWESGQVSAPHVPPGVAAARRELPGVLRAASAPTGTRIEDKGHAVAVHTRGTDDPDAALAQLRGPLELRELAAERGARSVLFSGDDLGDLAAFAAVRDLRAAGTPGVTVVSAAPESDLPPESADLAVNGPDGIAALLAALADAIQGKERP